MNKKDSKLKEFRDKLVANRRVVCTGNPNNPATLAHGIKKIFPSTTFIHRTAGWDLTNMSADTISRLTSLFKNHNTFINASYIAPNIQENLLDICNQSVKFCDVFNIGSTHEFDELGTVEYKNSKLSLREKSLGLHTYRFKTHHLMLGGIKTNDNAENQDFLNIDEICNIIPWILDQSFNIPLICIQQPKLPW